MTRQQGAPKPGRLKRKPVRTETPSQRYEKEPRSVVVVFLNIITSVFASRKNARRTISGEPAGHASTSRAPEPDLEADANVGPTPDVPPTEDADRLSATNSEVESAMNHRRRRAILRDACFSQEAFDAFNSGDAYIRAAQNGLARATDQYVKDIWVRKSDNYVYQ